MNSQRLQSVFALLMAGLMFAGNAWSGQAGLVQFVNGNVELTTAAGVTHAIHKGDPVNEGDTIISAKSASAQIKMLDGGFIAVRPETQMKFDSFKFSGKEGEPEYSFFSLAKGGFRAVTGLVGRVKKEDYHITTPAATIGIRGTDHETVVILADNPLVASGQAAPGSYNKVNLGETTITTEKGTINVLPNQMGFAGGRNQMPQIKAINTNLFTVAPQASGTSKGTATNTTAPATGGNTGTTDANSVGLAQPTVIQALPITGFVAGVYTGLVGLQSVTSPNSYTPFSNTPSTVSFLGGGVIANMTTTFDSTGLTRVDCGARCYAAIGTAQNVDAGGVTGVVEWGRWSNGVTVAGGWGNNLHFGPNQGWAYIIGTPTPQLPVTGSFSFNLIGGTSPTPSDGAGNGLGLGHLISGSVGVDFSTGNTSGNILMGFNGSTTFNAGWTNQSMSTLTAAGGVTGSAVVTGTSPCDGNCTTKFQGQFYGANAGYLGVGYLITTNQNFNINGVAAFKR